MNPMTPLQTIYAEILWTEMRLGNIEKQEIDTDNVDQQYEEFCETGMHWDSEREFRGGDIETNIGTQGSRHYESRSVAVQSQTGRWVGWTYWYGGGKHSNPDEIDWMEHAYFLDLVKEEEQTIIVREFAKSEPTP